MFVLGLTGSIAMGKSTCAAMFRALNIPVHEADTAVHAALAPGESGFAAVAAEFPQAVVDGTIDRDRLAAEVFADPGRLRRLEAILHPIVGRAATAFLRRYAFARVPLVVLDIPLLYESGGEHRTDAVLVVSAPAFLQRQRALRRPGMTAQKFDAIKARQLPDAEKRARADFVVTSALGRAHTFAALARLTALLVNLRGTVWAPGYGR